MHIQGTKKLLDQLKISPEIQHEEDPLFSWHANLVTVNRRKAVVLVNDKNRYVIILYGLVAKHFKKIEELIIESIKKTFQAEGIKENVIEQYIQHAPTFTFSKTKNKTSVARMNKSLETLYIYDDLLDTEKIEQTALNIQASQYLVGNGKGKYIHPNRQLYENLSEFAGQEVIQREAVQLLVTLKLSKGNVWRRLVVPLHLTFKQLHKVLQTAFDWKNYHLHEFYIYDGQSQQKKLPMKLSDFHGEEQRPILNIVCNEETLSYRDDIPTVLKHEIKLSKYLPEFKKLEYIYDFGDDWSHDIEVESFISNYNKNYPVCKDGDGRTPPEDVGGKDGYEMFLAIISDETHPNHQQMMKWGNVNPNWEFNLEQVNRLLKSMFY